MLTTTTKSAKIPLSRTNLLFHKKANIPDLNTMTKSEVDTMVVKSLQEINTKKLYTTKEVAQKLEKDFVSSKI